MQEGIVNEAAAARAVAGGLKVVMDHCMRKEHIKPRLLGHWGTTPGLNFIYVHMNRLIRQYDLNAVFIAGPGHGGPAMVANTYMEGTYSEVYPDISQDEAGLKRLFDRGDSDPEMGKVARQIGRTEEQFR